MTFNKGATIVTIVRSPESDERSNENVMQDQTIDTI